MTNNTIRQRKAEHVAAALEHDLSAPQQASWADIHLIHQAVPETDRDEIDCSVEFLGKTLRAPIFISAITGGYDGAAIINERLAIAAEKYGLAMGVGSQRAGIAAPELAETYAITRRVAPSAFLIANVGAPQIIPQAGKAPFTIEEIRGAISMIGADALALHLNYLQESAQPEGDLNARGVLAALAQLTKAVEHPVIAKETGAGISKESALALKNTGVQAIDTGGAGGSSMAAMEAIRAEKMGDTKTFVIGNVFRNWGIATPISIIEAGASKLPLISTGGVRSGLDAAKAIALGASVAGVAFPMLQAASTSQQAVFDYLDIFLLELKTAMQLTGSRNIAALQKAPVIIGGEVKSWLDLRGFEKQVKQFARRS